MSKATPKNVLVKHKDILKYVNQQSIHSFNLKFNKRRNSECWNWHGGKNNDGYGRFSVKRNNGSWFQLAAHRYSWVLHNKSNISGNLHICHNCDNPSCVNPYHLEAATYQENHRQKAERKRVNYEASRGERNTQSKLTNDEVLHIYSMKGKYSQRDIGRIYGITHATVGSIHLKKQWKHILAELP